jgi:hypothetical protein
VFLVTLSVFELPVSDAVLRAGSAFGSSELGGYLRLGAAQDPTEGTWALRGRGFVIRIPRSSWTQWWATALRAWSPGAAGLGWMPKRDNVHEAVVLFADRVPSRAIAGSIARDLGSPLGVSLMAKVLAEFSLAIG